LAALGLVALFGSVGSSVQGWSTSLGLQLRMTSPGPEPFFLVSKPEIWS
jgi:hypothetical protein